MLSLQPGRKDHQVELGRIEMALGEVYAKAGVLKEGAEFLTRATEHFPAIGVGPHFKAAVFQLGLGQFDRYRRICKQMLEATPSTGTENAPLILLTCCLGPKGPDPGSWTKLAETNYYSQGDPNAWAGYPLWMSKLRAGKYDEARKWLDHWRPVWFVGPDRFAWEALIAHHEGRADEAAKLKARSDQEWLKIGQYVASDALTLVDNANNQIWVAWLAARLEMNDALGKGLTAGNAAEPLVQARGYAALGLPEKARETLISLELPEDVAWMWNVRARPTGVWG